MPRNLSPAVEAALAAPQKTLGLFLELNFENAVTTLGALPTFPIVGVQVIAGVLYVVVSTTLTAAQEALLTTGPVSFEGVTVAGWLNNATLSEGFVGFLGGPGADTTISFPAAGLAGMPATYPFTPDTGTVVVGGVAASGVYDMLNWMTMPPAMAAANHFASTQLDGITPANNLYTQVNAGNFYWTKGDAGYPWDIQIFDATYIYLSTTELTFGSASQGKRFESLTVGTGLKGVIFAKRQMKIGDVVLGPDSRLAIYTACGTATYTQIGNTKSTLVGPFTETIPGAGSTLPANLTTIHLQYEWSLDSHYNHQTGSTMETYTLCLGYGLVRWQTQLWNMSTGSYDPPTKATNYNILTPGVSGIPFSDPCGFGTNGGGTLNPGPANGLTEAPLIGTSGSGSTQSGTTLALALWSGIGPMSSLGPAWDPGATFPYGQIFTGMGWMGRIESVPQNAELTAENMTLMLTGIPVNLLGDVVNTVRLSGTAELWLGFFSNGVLLPDPVELWFGALDVPSVSDGAETCSVTITVENALLSLNLSSNRRFTTLDQQLDFPGDTGFDYVSAMQDLYLPYPNGTINQGGNITSYGGAPSTNNALAITPSGAQKLTLSGLGTLQVSASAVFVTGPFSVAGGGPGSEVVTSVGLWTSSDPMVATVSSGSGANLNTGGGNFGTGGGLVTAVGVGNCTITFYFGQVSASLTVTVLP